MPGVCTADTTADPCCDPRVRELVLAYGWNSTAYQILNPGIEHWLTPTRDAVVGFVREHRRWITAGAPHHTVLSQAVGVEELHDLAEMSRTELVVIDADTTPRQLANELRWNQAYYRLARGF